MSDPYYRTAAWRNLRLAVLDRDPVCTTPGCHRPSVAVDHIIPRSKHGSDNLHNLRGLCIQCHNARRHGGEARAKGCDAAGTPRDPGHWWRSQPGNLSGLGVSDRWGSSARVSLTRKVPT